MTDIVWQLWIDDLPPPSPVGQHGSYYAVQEVEGERAPSV